jgi:hypothetical protein
MKKGLRTSWFAKKTCFHILFLDSSLQIYLFPLKNNKINKTSKIKVMKTRRLATLQKQVRKVLKYVKKSSWSFG